MKLGLVVLLFSVSAAPAVWPQQTAQAPASGSENAESHSCTDYFYGVGVPQSYEKAFACFEKADDDMWLILMTLNGQGTPFSVKRARELLSRAKQKPEHDEDTGIMYDECCDEQVLKHVEELIDEKDPTPGDLSICDFEVDPVAQANCQSALMTIMESKREEALTPLEAKLSSSTKATLGQIRSTFAELRTADSDWRKDEFLAGSTGAHNEGYAESFMQDALDYSNFASLLTKLVKDHALQRRSEQEYLAKDKELNSVYRQRVDSGIENLTNPGAPGGNDPKDKADYLDSAKQAQRAWIKLQEPWKKLCEELYRGEMPPAEIDRAIGTLLREIRIQEIQTDLGIDKDFFGTTFLLK